jgi:DNA polymerase family A
MTQPPSRSPSLPVQRLTSGGQRIGLGMRVQAHGQGGVAVADPCRDHHRGHPLQVHQRGAGVPGGTVTETDPKTASSRRTLPLPDRLVSVLKAAKARQARERLALGYGPWEYVVCNEIGQPYSPQVLSRGWRKAAKRAGVREIKLHVDGRNRAPLFPFGTKTGRNKPSGSRYIFGLPKWVRHLIKPAEGMAVAQLDYKNQEYRIAGVLSGDDEVLRVIESNDPYIEFAISSNMAPPGATKDTHPEIRATCKTLLLGVAYGMGAELFAARANIPLPRAQDIHARLKRTFARYT